MFAVGLVDSHFANSQQEAARVVVHAKRFAFLPGEITLKKGQTTKLVLISDDVRHGLAVKGLGIRAEIIPKHPTEILVTPAQAGDYPGGCSVYCGSDHRDMELVIHVVN
jgi:cytochrome c oxidase subunit II